MGGDGAGGEENDKREASIEEGRSKYFRIGSNDLLKAKRNREGGK